MKRLAFFLIMLLIAAQAFGQDLYDINTITTIDITFSESNWDQILDNLANAGQEERHLASVIVNGVSYDSVGIRYKGNSSYNSRNAKNPLNIKLDHIIDQSHQGYGTLKLANGYKDPSFIREVLSYDMARRIMPASLANWAWVTINGKDIGLYTSVQDVDKSFADEHFGSRNNPFFKGEISHGGGMPTTTTIWDYQGEDAAQYTGNFELESDEGWDALTYFLDVFNNQPESMDQVLNVNRHLWMLAYDNLLVNLDAPINFGHNYYLYQDDYGRFSPIIWDLNENFGVFSSLLTTQGPGAQLSTTSLQQLSPFLNASSSTYPIIQKVLSIPQYRKWYIAHMKTLINEFFTNDWYLERGEALQTIIDDYVQADNNKFYTYDNFKQNLSQSIGGFGGPGGGSIIGIAQLMEARINYLMGLNEFSTQAPTLEAPIATVSDQTVTITIEADHLADLWMAYRQMDEAPFDKVEMMDDGAHGDGSAGDGVYGAILEHISGQLHYYLVGENDDAATFSPALAGAETYSVTLGGALVINELQADNDNTVADQDGEYDDWIELYNNGDTTIDLSGYHLSDENDNLTKWAFPDTSIAAHSTLIVWADEDGSQAGLHASFKLSADGEALYLSDADKQLVDNVIFDTQAADQSHGRSPNGTGDFTQLKPTWSLDNTSSSTSVDSEVSTPHSFALSQNYPNPFNPQTTFSFTLPSRTEVCLTVYNMLGQPIKTLVDQVLDIGEHQYEWNASNMASGIYFYKLTAGDQSQVRRCLLLK